MLVYAFVGIFDEEHSKYLYLVSHKYADKAGMEAFIVTKNSRNNQRICQPDSFELFQTSKYFHEFWFQISCIRINHESWTFGNEDPNNPWQDFENLETSNWHERSIELCWRATRYHNGKVKSFFGGGDVIFERSQTVPNFICDSCLFAGSSSHVVLVLELPHNGKFHAWLGLPIKKCIEI